MTSPYYTGTKWRLVGVGSCTGWSRQDAKDLNT